MVSSNYSRDKMEWCPKRRSLTNVKKKNGSCIQYQSQQTNEGSNEGGKKLENVFLQGCTAMNLRAETVPEKLEMQKATFLLWEHAEEQKFHDLKDWDHKLKKANKQSNIYYGWLSCEWNVQ